MVLEILFWLQELHRSGEFKTEDSEIMFQVTEAKPVNNICRVWDELDILRELFKKF